MPPLRPLFTPAAGLLAGGCLLAVLAHDVRTGTGPAALDRPLLHWVLAHRSPGRTRLARLATDAAQGGVVPYAVLVLAAGRLARRSGQRRWLILGPAGLAGGQLVRILIRDLVARPRPPRAVWLAPAGSDAFPSGHTLTATVGFGLAAALAGRTVRPGRTRLLRLLAGLLAVSVGCSRSYLGVHWGTDVLGGWALGVGWLGLCALADRLATRRT